MRDLQLDLGVVGLGANNIPLQLQFNSFLAVVTIDYSSKCCSIKLIGEHLGNVMICWRTWTKSRTGVTLDRELRNSGFVIRPFEPAFIVIMPYLRSSHPFVHETSMLHFQNILNS